MGRDNRRSVSRSCIYRKQLRMGTSRSVHLIATVFLSDPRVGTRDSFPTSCTGVKAPAITDIRTVLSQTDCCVETPRQAKGRPLAPGCSWHRTQHLNQRMELPGMYGRQQDHSAGVFRGACRHNRAADQGGSLQGSERTLWRKAERPESGRSTLAHCPRLPSGDGRQPSDLLRLTRACQM